MTSLLGNSFNQDEFNEYVKDKQRDLAEKDH